MQILLEFGDISIGDFWGLGEDIPFNHNKEDGVSLVLVNTEKGAIFFEEIKDKIFFEKRTIEEAIKRNNQLKHPTLKPKNYNLFSKVYLEKGIKEALDKALV